MHTPELSVQEIPTWVRRYAQNRTIPVLLFFIAFGVVAIGIAGFSHLAGQAYRSGRYALFGWLLTIDILFLVANVFLSLPKWGGRWISTLGEELSAEQGHVELHTSRWARRFGWVGVVFGLCVAGSVIVGLSGLVEPRFMQPLSALYVVPFITFLILIQRPRSTYLMLIWPVLYAAHAIAILAGAPIFSGRLDLMNYLLPGFGYGLLAAVIAELYSRYGLKLVAKVSAEGDHRA